MDTYKATNTTNGKFYIGSTTNFERRKTEHLKCREGYPFQNALRKNPEAFEWEVWSDDLDEPILEQALLDMWHGKECCYNLNPSAQHPPRNAEAFSRGGVNQGNKNVKERTGFLSPEWLGSKSHIEHQGEAGREGGSKIVKIKLGIHSQDYKTSEKRKERDKKGAIIANAQVWVSIHDGFEGNAGNVARHNKANGWDPGDRIRKG